MSAIGDAKARIAPRAGLDDLPAALEKRYGIDVAGITPLDLGVLRIDRRDGPAWVARVFSSLRATTEAMDDAAVLAFLADHDYPAERCAAADAVFDFEGQPVLVTGFVDGVARDQRAETISALGGLRTLGDLLGRLATLPDPPVRPGGAWHHLAEGGPDAEVAATRALLDEMAAEASPARRRHFDALRAHVDSLDDCQGLPEGLLHADFVMANVVASPDTGLVMIDWAGAGRGPRLWSLAWFLYAEGVRKVARVIRVIDGYRRHVALEPEELERLPAAIATRPIMFAVWNVAVRNSPPAKAVEGAAAARALAAEVAACVRAIV